MIEATEAVNSLAFATTPPEHLRASHQADKAGTNASEAHRVLMIRSLSFVCFFSLIPALNFIASLEMVFFPIYILSLNLPLCISLRKTTAYKLCALRRDNWWERIEG